MAQNREALLKALGEINNEIYNWHELSVGEQSDNTHYQTPRYWNYIYADAQVNRWRDQHTVDIPPRFPYPEHLSVNTSVTNL